MNKHEIDDKINRFFYSVKDLLGSDFTGLSDEYDLSRPDLRLSSLPIGHMLSVFNKLNVTLDSVIQDTVDLDSLFYQYHGKDYLSSRYTSSVNFSSRFTSIYMIDFLRKTFGENSSRIIMQHLQLLPSHLKNSDEKNNIKLPYDICNYVYKYYGSEVVEQMGESSLQLLRNTPIGQELQKAKSLPDMFELFFSDIAPLKIEKNYDWKLLDINSSSVTVSGRPNKEVEFYIGKNNLVSVSLESLRTGFLNSLPKIHGNYFTNTRIIKSMASGDSCDVFKIEFSPAYDVDSSLKLN